jgi:hypothetical protein
VVADWMNILRHAQGPHIDQASATRRATLVVATIRGLLLDLLATGDRDRVQDAAENFFEALEQGTLRAPADTDTHHQR